MSSTIGPYCAHSKSYCNVILTVNALRRIAFAFTLCALRIAIRSSYGNLLSIDAKVMPKSSVIRAILRWRGI
jgi:hypothetical protein